MSHLSARGGLLATLALVGIAACGSGSSGGGAGAAAGGPPAAASSAPPVLTVDGQKINNRGQAEVTGRSTVEMTAENFAFRPSVLHGEPGQKITIHLRNVTATPHNVTLAAQKINDDLAPDKAMTLTVTLPASGTLVFTCEYHAKAGMAGALTTGASAPAAGGAANPGGY
jgi:plastocyanin